MTPPTPMTPINTRGDTGSSTRGTRWHSARARRRHPPQARRLLATVVGRSVLALLLFPGRLALAAPGVAPFAENKPLDIEALAAAANAPQVEDAVLSALLVKGKPAAASFARPVMLPGGVRAVAWSECSRAACLGYWALLDGDNESLKVLARGPLPVKEKASADDGLALSGSSVADLDGSGRPQVLFHYQVSEPPRPSLGALLHEYLTVLDPGSRMVSFHHELKRSGALSEMSCTATVIARLEGTNSALESRRSCAVRSCLEKTPTPPGCAAPTVTSERYLLRKGRYQPKGK
jgi:hypothetical protein